MENNNKIELFKFSKEVTEEQNIKGLILNKIALEAALKQVDKMSELYQEEIQKQAKLLHITKEGMPMFVSEMTDSHLLNTIKALLKRGAKFTDKAMKKYIAEAKKRNMVSDIININPKDEVISEEIIEGDGGDEFESF